MPTSTVFSYLRARTYIGLKYTNSDSKPFQGYFSVLEKGDIWFFFLALASFSLGSYPFFDSFSGYLYKAAPS